MGRATFQASVRSLSLRTAGRQVRTHGTTVTTWTGFTPTMILTGPSIGGGALTSPPPPEIVVFPLIVVPPAIVVFRNVGPLTETPWRCPATVNSLRSAVIKSISELGPLML